MKITKTQLREIIREEIQLLKESVNEESINEDIVTIALGVAGGLLLLKLLGKVVKSVLGFIGMNATLEKDKLKEVNEKLMIDAMKKAKSGDLVTFALFKNEIDKRIDSGKITKLKDIVDIIKKAEKGVNVKESANEGAGTLTIEKRKDGKYYWQYKFKSGKTEDWPAGFNTKADAQKDFMYRSKYIKESVNENEDWPKEHPSRHGDMTFRLEKVMADRAAYEILDAENNNRVMGRMVFKSPDSLKAFALDYIKPQGGRQSSQF